MTIQFRPAKREKVGLLIGLAGASGSGKSYSALRLARGLAGDEPFAVIDTEASRMLHYADDFQPWHHAELAAPFTPGAYAEAIAAADTAGYPVIVVDSASHEHAGDGGLLDMQEAEWAKAGHRDSAKMSSWIKPKMEHKRLVSRLLQVHAHLILCFRAEEKIEIIDDPKRPGKKIVAPKRTLTGLDGWVPISERNLPYELTVSVLLTPDAPGIPKPIKLQQQHRPMVPLDRPLSEQTGRDLARWASGDNTGDIAESADAPKLVSELLDLADRLGKRDATAVSVNAKRSELAGDPDRFAGWLRAQVARAQEKLDALPSADESQLFEKEPA